MSLPDCEVCSSNIYPCRRSQILTMDGKSLDEAKPLQEFIKANDVIEFDCHIYDKGGGIGSGKDKCNYYAMRAWKNSKVRLCDGDQI